MNKIKNLEKLIEEKDSVISILVEKVKQGLIGRLESSGHTTQGFCREGRCLMQKTCLHPAQEVQVQNNECPIKDVKGWKKVHASRTA